MSERPRASYYIVVVDARGLSVNSPQKQTGSRKQSRPRQSSMYGGKGGVREACDTIERPRQRQPQEQQQQQQQRRSTTTGTIITTISVRQQKHRQEQQLQHNTRGNNDSNKTVIRTTAKQTREEYEVLVAEANNVENVLGWV